MNKNIKSLLPHRYPFLFVDEIVSANADEIIGIKTFRKKGDSMLTGSFPKFEYIPGMIIIESMAQCGGAGIKAIGLAEGFFGLAGMDKVEFLKGVTYDVEITCKIKNIRISNRIIKQSGIAFVKSEPIVEATWVCVNMGNNQ